MSEKNFGTLAASAGVNAGASALGNLFSTGIDQVFFNRNLQAQKKVSMDLADYQQKLQKEMAADSASLQKEGLIKAGLNPALLSEGVGTIVGANVNSASGGSSGTMQGSAFGNLDISGLINAQSNKVLAEANARKANAEAHAQELENNWKDMMGDDYASKSILAFDLMLSGQSLSNDEIASRIDVNDSTVQFMRKQADQIDAQIKRWDIQNENDKKLVENTLKMTPAIIQELQNRGVLEATQAKSLQEQLPLILQNLEWTGSEIQTKATLNDNQATLARETALAIPKQLKLTERGQTVGAISSVIGATLIAASKSM